MMVSQTSGQERLFYSFNLDDHIPSDYLVSGIDRFLDLAHCAASRSVLGLASLHERRSDW